MQPIILLAIVGIAGGAMGVGFLGNDITLSVQELGVGDEDIGTPISNANIDFNIDKIKGDLGFKNVIADCIIQADKEIAAKSKVFCKLTDKDGFVAAEGFTVLKTHLNAGSLLTVHIDDPTFVNSQVQNIHDIILVVQGPAGISTPPPR